MICDVHAHYTPKNFSAFMGDRFASPTHLAVKRGMALHPFSDSPEDIEDRFKLMDDAGVERQVLSPNHPPYLPDEAECVKAVQDAQRRLRRTGAPLSRSGSPPTSCCRCRTSTRR